jgi:hypothetical protein
LALQKNVPRRHPATRNPHQTRRADTSTECHTLPEPRKTRLAGEPAVASGDEDASARAVGGGLLVRRSRHQSYNSTVVKEDSGSLVVVKHTTV